MNNTTKDLAELSEVVHDYSSFDFTKVPLLESEDDFQEYHKAFMEKYGNHPYVKECLDEEPMTEEVFTEASVTDDGQSMTDVLEAYNTCCSLMGHYLLGETDEDYEGYWFGGVDNGIL